MAQPPKNVKKGDPVKSKEYNKVLQELRRLGKLFDANNKPQAKNLRLDQVWFGVTVDAGPAAEADYVDSRYWVQRSKLENDENDNTEEAVSFQKYTDGPDYKYEIITATNLAEARLDADSDDVNLYSHRVQVGTNVVVLRFLDDGDPSTPRYFFYQTPSNLQRMRVKGEENDYLRCKTWDGTTEGTDTIYVAKPYDLQRTPFDGNTVNSKTYTYRSKNRREVNVSSRTYSETIREEYYNNAEIYAEYRPKGDTGVTGTPIIYWIDSNQAARRWMRASYLLENCQDSNDKMLVAGDLYDYIGRVIRLYSTGEICWKVSSAFCDCDLEEVVVEDDFSTCDDCLPVCVTLTRCSGETGGSATLEVRSNGAILNATIVEYDGTCYTVTLPEDTCTGSEIEIAPGDWTNYDDCDSCRLTCHELTCCDTSETLDVKARGLLKHTGGTKTISVNGTPGCWTVGAEETCVGHVLIEYQAFASCSACNSEYYCYGYTPCDEDAPDDIVIYSVGQQYNIGDVVLIEVDNTTWCYEITSVSTGRDTCNIPCGHDAGTSTTNAHYNITGQEASENCEECSPCWTVVRCDDETITDIFRGLFEIGKIYSDGTNCWEVTGPANCTVSETTDDDNASVFDTCLECESDGNCYNITPCAGGAATLVSGPLEGISTICLDGVSYTVASATCTGSEIEVGAYTELVDCNECPEGWIKITVVTAFNDTTCEVTTQDVCVKDIGCTA